MSNDDFSSKGALLISAADSQIEIHAAGELRGSIDADTCSNIRIIRHE